jgi:antirestriction protein ArdC
MHRKISAVVALLHITGTSRLLQLLKGDPKAVFTAAARASEAVNYLNALQHSSPRADPAAMAAGPAALGDAAMPVISEALP